MIEAILVVLTKALAGREADLDDWYTNIHIRDALRFRGSIAAQRFSRSAYQPMDLPGSFDWQYLALYDVFDAERFSREHWENALTSRMMVTNAIDDSVLEDYHYYPLAFRDNDPDTPHQGGVVLEQLNAWQGWQGADALAQAPCVDQSSLRITHWDRLTERLTRDDVQNPTSAGLAAEEQARARMGDRVLTGGVEKLGSA